MNKKGLKNDQIILKIEPKKNLYNMNKEILKNDKNTFKFF